ncbi:MAG: glutathione S-transferase [SAR86 cluster bacterium]|uniref:Glutathione S-transferase n=1 Tax=SAR86 cluster bacterium TaxID=2030880 RepID=A0A2A4X7B6_9GAMM|nr:MAG: glutathione S-transferase [SAR86 cluster bacterium]
MKHYFNPMSRGVTTDWILTELDVPHEQILIDIESGGNDTLEFRNINPMGKLPTLVDGEIVVTETAAICAYLADKFPAKNFAPELGSYERAAYYRYLFFTGNTIEPAFTLNASGYEHPQPGQAGWGDMSRVLATIEVMTPEKDWALGSQFTAADVVFGGMLDFSMIFNLFEATPKVVDYVERIRVRPAYRKTHSGFINMGFSIS